MGAPKQKWTAEEEAALKAGVTKHGTGKWRTILSDSEFSMVLKSRSNIDLKDKWRNISVTAVYGSRTKAKQARRSLPVPEEDDNNNASAVSIVPSANVEERANASSPGGSGETSRRSLHSLDNVILEAITNLKEPHGSDRTAIFEYIEENFKTRANLKWHVLERLEHLTSNGTLVKIEHKYRFSSVGARQESPQLFSEGNGSNIPFKSRRDGELRINGLTVHEAAEAAARAIAEAEFASAEAREAEKEAERLEAEAEAAEIFAIAAMKALKLSMRNQAS